MANGFGVLPILKQGATQAVAQNQTKQVVSGEATPCSAGDTEITQVFLTLSSTVVATSVTAYLEDTHDGGTTWNTVASASISNGATSAEIVHNIHDGAADPMWPVCRVSITTGAGDSLNVTACRISRRR